MYELFKGLGDENRLRIINLLSMDEFCVCEIEVLLDMTQSNVSRHLNKLKNLGIITSSKAAQWVHYRVSEDFVRENDLLYRYLIDSFEKEGVFINDVLRLNVYRENGFSCKWINEDKEKVMGVLDEN
jgi:ArsR family transcriptional regulator